MPIKRRGSPLYEARSRLHDVTVVQTDHGIALLVDGVLRTIESDEKKFFAYLVLPAMVQAGKLERVLVLGGGDGLATRDVLKFGPDSVTVIDPDCVIFGVAQKAPFTALNNSSLTDAKVTKQCAMLDSYLKDVPKPFDVVIVHLPDPTTDVIAKLYNSDLARLLRKAVAKGGTLSFVGTMKTGRVGPVISGLEKLFKYKQLITKEIPLYGERKFLLVSDLELVPRRNPI